MSDITGAFNLFNATGTVDILPNTDDNVCEDLEIDITFRIQKNLTAGIMNEIVLLNCCFITSPLSYVGTVLYIFAPGLTSGPCTVPRKGKNIESVELYNQSVFSLKFVEGLFKHSLSLF